MRLNLVVKKQKTPEEERLSSRTLFITGRTERISVPHKSLQVLFDSVIQDTFSQPCLTKLRVENAMLATSNTKDGKFPFCFFSPSLYLHFCAIQLFAPPQSINTHFMFAPPLISVTRLCIVSYFMTLLTLTPLRYTEFRVNQAQFRHIDQNINICNI